MVENIPTRLEIKSANNEQAVHLEGLIILWLSPHLC